MAELIPPMTELEAVNQMLRAIGESPVAQLDGEFVDASIAQTILTQNVKATQMPGYEFNTDKDYSISPDVNGYINLPVNLIKFKITGERKYVQRGTKLYNNEDNTDVFTEAIEFNTFTVTLPFEELPEVLRMYITVMSALRFQNIMAAEPSLHQFSREDLLMAKSNWDNWICETEQLNVSQSSTWTAIKGAYR